MAKKREGHDGKFTVACECRVGGRRMLVNQTLICSICDCGPQVPNWGDGEVLALEIEKVRFE